MPIPFLFIVIAVGTGCLGLGKTVKAGFDTHKAKKITSEANQILEDAKIRVNKARRESGKKLEKLGKTKIEVLDSSINHFVRSFEQIKNIDFTQSTGLTEINKLKLDKQALKELKEMGGFATSILGGVAGGAMGGAMAAYGAWGLATHFAAASTTTLISSLSGAAATNATLAFFGGGSLAAGGLGMAGGTAVLGGLVAGPALAIMGFIVGAKASKAKDDAYANLAIAKRNAKELDLAVTLCNAISSRCEMFCKILKDLDRRFKPLLQAMDDTISAYGTDYSKYPIDNKKSIAAAATLAVSIKSVLDTPILTKNGELTADSEKVVREYKSDKKKITNATSRKATTHKALTIEEIVEKCSYEKFSDNESSDTQGLSYSYFGRLHWNKLIEMVNTTYGVDYGSVDYELFFEEFRENKQARLWDVAYKLSKYVYLYQIGSIAQLFSKKDILNSRVVKLDEVDWNGLIDKIDEVYGVKMAVWQLTSAKEKNGTIQPIAVFEQIYTKLSSQTAGYQKNLLFADNFARIAGNVS